MDLALDAAGNLFCADQASQKVRKITPTGDVSTVAGNGNLGNKDGTGDGATLFFPSSLSFGKVGGTDVLFVGQADGKLRVITGW